VGLLASTSGRLYSSAFYALRDTRTPLNFALIRVTLTLAPGHLCALPLPRLLHIDQRWGAAGLTLSAGIAGWIEFVLLRGALHKRIGIVIYSVPRVLKMWSAALIASALGVGVNMLVRGLHPLLGGILVLGIYGGLYLGLTHSMGISELAGLRLLRRNS
jgi:putative peptidoglycan lipid II flippase